jgi:putative membrane protein PagO
VETERFKISSGYVLICLLWGSTWMAIKIGVDELAPIFAAGARFIFASLFFYLLMKVRKVKLQTDYKSIKLYVLMGIFSFVIPFGLVYWAEQFVSSGLTSVLFAIFPILVILFSWISIPDDKIGIYKVGGSLIGFIGIYFIFSDDLSVDISNDLWGMIAILVSATMQAAIAVVIKKHGEALNPLSMNFIPVTIAAAIMLPYGLLFEDLSQMNFSIEAIMSILYLAFFGTVLTFTTYYWLMKRMNIVILSLSSLITPIIAVLLGWYFLGETLSTNDFIGTILVLFGLLAANTRGLLKYFKIKGASN